MFRLISRSTEGPSDPAARKKTQQLTAFLIESNCIRYIGEKELDEHDVETEAAPFLDHSRSSGSQAGVYLGRKFRLEDWTGAMDVDDPPESYHHPLTLVDSANPLFADYQAHNTNVFSMHDDLSYISKDDGQIKTMDSAEASYLVLGFYGQKHFDPLAMPASESNATRLDSYFMDLQKPSKNHEYWLRKPVLPLRTLCRGVVTNIKWKIGEAPGKVPADDAAILFRRAHPFGIGNDLTDAVSAYFEASPDGDKKNLAKAFKSLEILAQNPDDSEASQEAPKMFQPNPGGLSWHEKGKTYGDDENGQRSALAAPSKDKIQTLHDLNAAQLVRDTVSRQYKLFQHLLFCEWWKYQAIAESAHDSMSHSEVADSFADAGQQQAERNLIRQEVDRLVERLNLLKSLGSQLDEQLQSLSDDAPEFTPVAKATFFSVTDPTLIIAGMDSGWPSDTTSKVSVSLDTDHLVDDRWIYKTNPQLAQDIQGRALAKLPRWMQKVSKSLLFDWASNIIQARAAENEWHDTQPWFPLFIEWELDYFHIPYEYWELHEARNGAVRYRIKPLEDLSASSKITGGGRGLSGRTEILPEASKTLQTLAKMIFARSNPEELNRFLPGNAKEELLKELSLLTSIFSAKLNGLTDHLLTLVQGTHATAQDSIQGSQNSSIPSTERTNPFERPETVEYLADHIGSEKTPYGDLSNHAAQWQRGNRPDITIFRPVTHGQCRFTKLNLVDKFGQVISAFDPQRGQPFHPIYPCVSDSLSCQLLKDGTKYANTAEAEPEGRSQFFQLGPRINQDARLNAFFVTKDDDDNSEWRRILEWENPIWGWLVINFKDKSLQVFEGDGKMKGELLVGAGKGDHVKWLNPLASTNDVVTVDSDSSSELVRFMNLLTTKPAYLKHIWNMLIDANEHLHHAPSSYGDFLPAIIGRPVALITMGWSLELATQPMIDQSAKRNAAVKSESLLDYEFEVKIGDKYSLSDGLVALIPESSPEDETKNHLIGNFNFECLYTQYGHFKSPEGFASPAKPTDIPESSPLTVPKEFCKLSPYFIDPAKFTSDAQSIDEFTQEHNRHMRIFAGMIDPFQSVHGYSGVLPVQSLRVPAWALDIAMKNITTFFRYGPLLLAGDIPPSLLTDTKSATQASPVIPTAPATPLDPSAAEQQSIPFAVPSSGKWSWIQPRRNSKNERFIYEYPTKKPVNKFDLHNGPQTAIEGFLKLETSLAEEAHTLPPSTVPSLGRDQNRAPRSNPAGTDMGRVPRSLGPQQGAPGSQGHVEQQDPVSTQITANMSDYLLEVGDEFGLLGYEPRSVTWGERSARSQENR